VLSQVKCHGHITSAYCWWSYDEAVIDVRYVRQLAGKLSDGKESLAPAFRVDPWLPSQCKEMQWSAWSYTG
jgi:hypothetical protein